MKFMAKWRVRKPADDAQTAYVSERFGVRTLHIGSDTVQSAMRIARPYDLELSYTRSMMAFLLFMPRRPREVLLIGLGGGSLAKFIYRALPAARVRAVELSAQVVAIARHYFHVPANEPRLQVIVGDGAEYMTREDVSADLVVVDGYGADAHAEELGRREFYRACNQRLTANGMLVVNLWGGDREFTALLRRIEDAFPEGTLCLPAERPGNVIVFGFKKNPGAVAWKDITKRADALENEIGLEYGRFAEALRKMNRHDKEHLYP
ncbi:MAG TPA: methyltransferase domain-containing protein [Burkholderiales bacterium]|nr:methyltransferase domain-containing protein [Burkholderiales bacterium]